MMNIEILCDSAHGQYIPNIMINRLIGANWIVDCNNMEDLQNVDCEHYWETWDQVLNNAEFVDQNGDKWFLHHDGDLFAYCPDLMSEQEKNNFFGVE